MAKSTVVAEIRDRKGWPIIIRRYHHSLQKRVMELFREGYPDSFDGNDLRQIKKLTTGKTERTFLLAFDKEELVGAFTGFIELPCFNHLYVGGYLYVREDMREMGIATMLLGVAEEILKHKARVIVGINAGILPDYEVSFDWFKKVGFKRLGKVKYLLRDDLAGILFGKRNPYWPIGKGIPKNSGWYPELVDSETRESITLEKYEKIMHDPGPVSPQNWGIDLIGRDKIVMGVFKIKGS